MGRQRTAEQLERHRTLMRSYRQAAAGKKCSRCGSLVLDKLRRCSWCLAKDSERRHPDKRHDTFEHAELIERCRNMDTRCDASGITLRRLLKADMHLEVDRIDPREGYTVPNMQVITSLLNRLKAREASWPWWAIEEVRSRVENAENQVDEFRAYMPEGGY